MRLDKHVRKEGETKINVLTCFLHLSNRNKCFSYSSRKTKGKKNHFVPWHKPKITALRVEGLDQLPVRQTDREQGRG